MSELTPEQQAELALVRAIADSLRRRMPDLGDRTLGRIAFHIADLLNGVAVVLTSDADSGFPANWEPPRPQPIDPAQPATRASTPPPPAPAEGEYPAGRPGRPSGEFPAVRGVTGEFPAAPPTGEFPAVRPSGEFPAVRPTGEFPAVRGVTGEFPVAPPTGEIPAVRSSGDFPAVRPAGEFPAVRSTGDPPATPRVPPTGEFPAVPPAAAPPTGEFPAVRPTGGATARPPARQPRIRFPARPGRRPEPLARRGGPPGDALDDTLQGDRLADVPKGPWIAEFFQLDGTPLEQAQWAEREQALRGVSGRIRWLAFDGTEVTVRLRGPGGIDMDHEAVLAAIDRMRRG